MILDFRSDKHHVAAVRLNPFDFGIELFALEDGRYTTLINVFNPLTLEGFRHEIGEYRVYLFQHHNWPESKVMRLSEGKRRVGLLFSLQALSSSESVLPSDPSWNAYGAIALQLICLGQYQYGPEILRTERFAQTTLSHLIGDDVLVAVLDRASCVEALGEAAWPDFFEQRLYSLAKFGVFPLDEDSPGPRIASFTTRCLDIEEGRASLALIPYSPLLPEPLEAFLRSIFLKTASHERHPVFRFFLGYQTLELLMEELYLALTQDFADKVSRSSSSSEYKDLFRELQHAVAESERLSRILNAIRSNHTQESLTLLKASIDRLLNTLGQGSSPNVETGLYAVRNLLFHRYSAAIALSNEVDVVARHLFVALCDLFLYYKKPSGTL